jgi:hypothetical protein
VIHVLEKRRHLGNRMQNVLNRFLPTHLYVSYKLSIISFRDICLAYVIKSIIMAWLFAILFSTLAFSQPLVFDPVNSVSYQGFTSTPATLAGARIDTFLNIPYVQDTGGRNSFAPPKPYLTHVGQVFDRTKPGIHAYNPLLYHYYTKVLLIFRKTA